MLNPSFLPLAIKVQVRTLPSRAIIRGTHRIPPTPYASTGMASSTICGIIQSRGRLRIGAPRLRQKYTMGIEASIAGSAAAAV